MINNILNILYKNKVINIKIINNKDFYFEFIIIATSNSRKHIESIAFDLSKIFKNKDFILSGEKSDWLVFNFNFVVVHIMLKEIRILYNLESLYLNKC